MSIDSIKNVYESPAINRYENGNLMKKKKERQKKEDESKKGKNKIDIRV